MGCANSVMLLDRRCDRSSFESGLGAFVQEDAAGSTQPPPFLRLANVTQDKLLDAMNEEPEINTPKHRRIARSAVSFVKDKFSFGSPPHGVTKNEAAAITVYMHHLGWARPVGRRLRSNHNNGSTLTSLLPYLRLLYGGLSKLPRPEHHTTVYRAYSCALRSHCDVLDKRYVVSDDLTTTKTNEHDGGLCVGSHASAGPSSDSCECPGQHTWWYPSSATRDEQVALNVLRGATNRCTMLSCTSSDGKKGGAVLLAIEALDVVEITEFGWYDEYSQWVLLPGIVLEVIAREWMTEGYWVVRLRQVASMQAVDLLKPHRQFRQDDGMSSREGSFASPPS